MNETVTADSGLQTDGLGSPAAAWHQLQSAFQQALWSGDLTDAEVVAAKAFRHGNSVMPVYEQLMAPALHRVGDLWSKGELTVADEHLATEATLRAMAGVFGLADGRDLAAGAPRCVVTASAEGERHGVGLRMVADALELAGHEVVHCGIDTPLEDLVALAESVGADAVAISFTLASSGDNLVATTTRIWERLPNLPILVGGQGLPDHLPPGPVRRLGSLDELVAVVDGLPRHVALPAPPARRGNPLAASRGKLGHLELVPPPADPPALGDAHLQTILGATDDAIAIVDTHGTVTAWNGAADALFGLPASEALGRRLTGLIGPPERARMVQRRLREALAGRTIEVREQHTSPGDGAERTVLQRLAPIRSGAAVVGVAMVARDITAGHHHPDGSQGGDSQRLWHHRIEHALAEDRFVLAAQPIIDLATDKVDHCELLLRLRMGGQIVMPGEFIPPAEHSGQIRAIDRWVVEHGIELAGSCPIAVNLSGASLTDPSLLEVIEATLGRTEIDPDRVTFEITETAAAENIEAAAALVTRLRDLGCRVALDDFGTGFGSFTYLSRLPVTELKIDNQFARGVRTGVAERRVIDAVVSVGEAFGIRTVAEGIEDEETLEIMKAAGIDLGQGWHFGRPQLVEEGLEGASSR